jgi:hypothetical protein
MKRNITLNDMEVTPTYVTLEQAKKLKEKGWKQRVKMVYLSISNKSIIRGVDLSLELMDNEFNAPEQWQVIEWLRVNHNIWVATDVDCRDLFGTNLLFFFRICNIGEYLRCLNISEKYFEYPQEATSAAIDYVLDNLI